MICSWGWRMRLSSPPSYHPRLALIFKIFSSSFRLSSFFTTSHNLLQVVKEDGTDQLVNKVDCACVLAVEIDDLSSIPRYQSPNPKSLAWGKVDSVIVLLWHRVAHGTCAGVDSGVAIRWGYSQLRHRVPYTMFLLWFGLCDRSMELLYYFWNKLFSQGHANWSRM